MSSSSRRKPAVMATVRGTLTPSVYVRRGEEKTVLLDERWERLIAGGHVEVVATYRIPAKPAKPTQPPVVRDADDG